METPETCERCGKQVNVSALREDSGYTCADCREE